MYLASTLSAHCLTEGCGVLSKLMFVSCCCSATNLTAAQFRGFLCRVPFLQIRRNQLPPRAGCETARLLLSWMAACLPNNLERDASLVRQFPAFPLSQLH